MLAKRYRKKGFVIAAQDEATFGLLPQIVKGWARKGSRPIMIQHPKNKCMNVFGARSKRCFVFFFCKKKKPKKFVEFLILLLKKWGRVCLFTDNAPWHKGKLINAFLEAHPKTFKLMRFLKYSPELNPTESCWTPARRVVRNRLIHSLPALRYHLYNVFSKPSLLPKMFSYLSG